MNWKDYYMSIANAVSQKSKDPSSKVGCIIVGSDNRIQSQGFNGFVAKCNEELMTFDRPMKYHLIIHAEMNALNFAREDLKDSTLYCTHGPCENCLKHTLQAGIRTIYYKDPSIVKDRGSPEQKEAIFRLIKATQAKVINSETGELYENDILKPEEYEGMVKKVGFVC